MTSRRPPVPACLVVASLLLPVPPLPGAEALSSTTARSSTRSSARPPAPRHPRPKVQDLVDAYKARLSISAQVTVAIVPRNELLVSVKSSEDRPGAFDLSLEEGFLDALDDGDLEAVIAHELGHVWIFTHHPFLQTERLANQIAQRVVSRDSLAKVYGKVWERGGTKGDLARFLGE
jgi:hypothetical protein